MRKKKEVATLGGGCFWCLEPVFSDLAGVLEVVPGYAGGTLPHPSYEEVCSGTTGHAEVVQVAFDPDVISFEDLLQVFFSVHDPTTRNRQGHDVGTQYRSIVLYHNEKQRKAAEDAIQQLESEKIWSRPIVTEIQPLSTFYPAEEHHRDYFRRNPDKGYCAAAIAPKVAKFRKAFAEKLKS